MTQAVMDPADQGQALQGLTEAEALARRENGQGNNIHLETSRPYGDILRKNFLNAINVVLFVIGGVMVGIGRVSDAVVSLGLITMNVVIGVFQEIKAKRQLDRIALLTRPRTTLIREGRTRSVDPAEIVVGDVLVLQPGDQVVVDGLVLDGNMEVDESQLTGESDLIRKEQGDEVFSGSFCVTGKAVMEARKVGADSFANQISAHARAFRVVKTPLQRDIDLVIRLLILIAAFIGLLMVISSIIYRIPLMRSTQMAAVIAGIIPNGLFFMVIVAYAMGAVRIVRTGALVQQANSVESLSNVDILCMDKTGTLTANRILFNEIQPVGADRDACQRLLGNFASSAASRNKTSQAIVDGLGGEVWSAVDEVPFSSARKWSALSFAEDDMRGAFVLGAPEMLEAYLDSGFDYSGQLAEWSARGLRVLLFARHGDQTALHDAAGEPALPEGLTPLCLVSFSDELRPETKSTLARFIEAGIRVKIISGDNPQTVASLALQAGLPAGMETVSGPELAGMDDAQFTATATEATIFGRITPEQKERLVEVLHGQGYYVAMIGDGVNDVLSLKKSQLGIAMQSGSSATRGVADMVLLNDSFAALPPAFLEGQRILNGMQDILRLFLTRTLYVTLLIVAIMVIQLGFPFSPKHSSLVAGLTVGLPTFGIAVWARPRKRTGSLLKSVFHFVFPASISVFVFGLLVYSLAFGLVYLKVLEIDVPPEAVTEFQEYAGINYDLPTVHSYAHEVSGMVAQSALTVFTTLAGLLLLVFVEPPIPAFVGGDVMTNDKRPTFLAVVLLGVFMYIYTTPSLRDFFELIDLTPPGYLVIVLITIIWALILRRMWRQRWLERFLHLEHLVDRRLRE